MSFYSILFVVVANVFLFVLIKTLIQYRLIRTIKGREQELRSSGVNPSGSSLAHGMYVNATTGRIEHDQIESLAWYKRLAE